MVVHPANAVFIDHFSKLGPSGARIVDSLRRYPLPLTCGTQAGYLDGVGKTYEGDFQEIIQEQCAGASVSSIELEKHRLQALIRLEKAWRILPKPKNFDSTAYNPVVTENSSDDEPLLETLKKSVDKVKPKLVRPKTIGIDVGSIKKRRQNESPTNELPPSSQVTSSIAGGNSSFLARIIKKSPQPFELPAEERTPSSSSKKRPREDLTQTSPPPSQRRVDFLNEEERTPPPSQRSYNPLHEQAPSSSSQARPDEHFHMSPRRFGLLNETPSPSQRRFGLITEEESPSTHCFRTPTRQQITPASSYARREIITPVHARTQKTPGAPLPEEADFSFTQLSPEDPLLTQCESYDGIFDDLNSRLEWTPERTLGATASKAGSDGKVPLTPKTFENGQQPGDLVMLIDTREEKWFPELLRNAKMMVEVRSLPVGDITWIWRIRENDETTEIMAGSIIERKALPDLSKSIVDGRYNEQKGRMANIPLKKAYLVEGRPPAGLFYQLKAQAAPMQFGQRQRLLPMSSLAQACVTTQLRDGYGLLRTKNPRDSTSLLKKVHEGLRMQGMSTLNAMTYEEFAALSRKTGELSAKDILGRMLRQIPSFGAESVTAMFDALQEKATFTGLVDAHRTEESREKFNDDLKANRSGRRALSKSLLTSLDEVMR